MRSLRQMFIDSKGRPLTIDGAQVVQMDRWPCIRGRITLTASEARPDEGVSLKVTKGAILLSDGPGVPHLHVWFEPGLPLTEKYFIECDDGELRVWNIYRTKHSSGVITEDAWTGNAGMIVTAAAPNKRLYRCSRNLGPFDPSFEFSLEWEPLASS
jgi:hypothetical protein